MTMETVVDQISLPPGFRFHPTDEELLVQYLLPRTSAGSTFSHNIIAEVDLYRHDPWDLPGKALFGDKEWYFFSPRDRKYPNGLRPNRAAGSGFWKATGTDKTIMTDGRKVGIKKALVFCTGKPPSGTKTNWIMHEYRLVLDDNGRVARKKGTTHLDDWVLCRIYEKKTSVKRGKQCSKEDSEASSPFSEDMFAFLSGNDDQPAGSNQYSPWKLLETDTGCQQQQFPANRAVDPTDDFLMDFSPYMHGNRISMDENGGGSMFMQPINGFYVPQQQPFY